jgi:DNA primase catalytic core, N-terminal domain/Toprim domain
MITSTEMKELNRGLDIGALMTFIGAPIENLRPHKKTNKGIVIDWRINAFFRGGDNPSALGITFYPNESKWRWSDFTHRTFGNIDTVDFLTGHMGYSFRKAIDVMVFASGNENGVQAAEKIELEPQTVVPTYFDKTTLEAFNSGKLHPYWAGRGYTPEIAKMFQLGYCNLNNLLKDRLTIPILDENMKIIAFQGRAANDETFPKYCFGSTEQGYLAKRTLYNYRVAKVHAMSRGWVGVVEGAPSVWRAVQYDYGNFVATLSNTTTPEQVKLLCDMGVDNIVIFADNDATQASQASAVKLAAELKQRGKNVWLTMPPTLGDDPADTLKDTFMLSLKMAAEFKGVQQ